MESSDSMGEMQQLGDGKYNSFWLRSELVGAQVAQPPCPCHSGRCSGTCVWELFGSRPEGLLERFESAHMGPAQNTSGPESSPCKSLSLSLHRLYLSFPLSILLMFPFHSFFLTPSLFLLYPSLFFHCFFSDFPICFHLSSLSSLFLSLFVPAQWCHLSPSLQTFGNTPPILGLDKHLTKRRHVPNLGLHATVSIFGGV